MNKIKIKREETGHNNYSLENRKKEKKVIKVEDKT